eukprot:2354384-Lingulodinium_polyedra.AAC.1
MNPASPAMGATDVASCNRRAKPREKGPEARNAWGRAAAVSPTTARAARPPQRPPNFSEMSATSPS